MPEEIIVTGTRVAGSFGAQADMALAAIFVLLVAGLFSKRLRDALQVPFLVALPLGVMTLYLLVVRALRAADSWAIDTFGSAVYEDLSDWAGMEMPGEDAVWDLLNFLRDLSEPVVLFSVFLFAAFWGAWLLSRIDLGAMGLAGGATVDVPERPILPPRRSFFGRLISYFSTRRAILADRASAVRFAADPAFHPAGYVMMRASITALPAAVITGVISYLASDFSLRDAGRDLVVSEIYSLTDGLVRPLIVPFTVAFVGFLAAWTLRPRGADANSQRLARAVYLAYAGTWGFWPQLFLLTGLSLASVAASDSDAGDALWNWATTYLYIQDENSLASMVILALLVGLSLWQLYLSLVRIPLAVMAQAFPGLGVVGRGGRLVVHAFVLPFVSILIAVILELMVELVSASAAYAGSYLLEMLGFYRL
ncbi:MAG: hypothetical protein HXY22_13625 [Alphaproteobacteria bacterium]|nr:hypothetical protein [Alphaproteobacteria bacterium]